MPACSTVRGAAANRLNLSSTEKAGARRMRARFFFRPPAMRKTLLVELRGAGRLASGRKRLMGNRILVNPFDALLDIC